MRVARAKVISVSLFFVFIFCLIAAWLYFRRPGDFLTREPDYYVPDALAGHVHKPYAKREFAWAEHEKGRVLFRTNNLGFREDEDTEVTKPERTFLFLVTGDSHTDGVVYNAESFPNLLEQKLNSTPGAPKFEVINGGTGYYTFQNYAGFFRKYLYLKPDYFIVTIYTGNDFMESIAAAVKAGQLTAPSTPFWYRLKLRLAPAPLVSQALNQIIYFKAAPQMKEVALEIARRQLKEISDTCLQNNVRLVVVFLPTKLDVEDRDRLREVKNSFGLTDAEANVNQDLKGALINWLVRQDVKYFDIAAYMSGNSDALFWEKDYHLNVRGHKLVSDALYADAEFTQ